MKKKLLCLSLVVLFGYAAGICLAKYSGGDGSLANPYRISDANDMNDIGLHDEDWGSHFVMVNDVNLAQFTGTQFNIIGNESNPFTGVFDGNGFTISNFTYSSTGPPYIGLFGYVYDANTVIKNLTLIDPNVYVGGIVFLVGSLAGRLCGATITNCNTKGAYISGKSTVGGLVGENNGTISNCYATGDVNGNNNIGGLVGCNIGVISNCYATASVNGKISIGGLVGSNTEIIALTNLNQPFLYEPMQGGILINPYAESTIEGSTQLHYGIINSYATGNVTGDNRTGGLVGGNAGNKIFGCYATGDVLGDAKTGGLVGWNYAAELSNCYATGGVTGDDNIGGLVGSSEPDWWRNVLSGITNCYAIGGVSGTTNVGGLSGYSDGTSYTKCFWNSDINPDVNGIGNRTDPNVIGETTENMQTESTFTSAGWDFVGETINGANDIWTINDGNDYPVHVWPLINFVGWYEVDLADYAFFSKYWKDTNCGDANDCNGVDLDFSDAVDGKDLKILFDKWLTGLQ